IGRNPGDHCRSVDRDPSDGYLGSCGWAPTASHQRRAEVDHPPGGAGSARDRSEMTMQPILTMYAIALLLPMLSKAQSAQTASAGTDPLDAYVSCQYTAGFSVVSTMRLPGNGVRYRTGATSTGERKVSLVDGYRLMVAQDQASYFANMKIERSAP